MEQNRHTGKGLLPQDRLNHYRVNFFMNFEVTYFQFIIIDTDTVHRVPTGAHPNVYYISQLIVENEKLRVQFG